jgi:hypothetical protein
MISTRERRGSSIRLPVAAAAVLAAVTVAGCAGSTAASSAPTASATHAAAASSSQAPTAANSPSTASGSPKASAGSSGTASGKPPDYEPSRVVSSSASSTVLASPDAVAMVAEFYKESLAKGGWHLTSYTIGAYSASFTATRGNEAANISVYHTGSGSGISINTHPT